MTEKKKEVIPHFLCSEQQESVLSCYTESCNSQGRYLSLPWPMGETAGQGGTWSVRRPQLIKQVQTREVPQPEGKEGRKSQPSLSYERSGKEGLRSSRVTSGLKTLYVRGGEALYPGGWQRTWKHFQKEDVLNKSSEKSPRLSPNHGSRCIEWKYWRCSGTPHA